MIGVLSIVLTGTSVVLAAPAASARPAVAPAASVCASPGTVSDADALGDASVTKFLRLLKTQDVPGLRAFLAADFQLVRADGSADTKRSYLKKDLPDITSFTVRRVHARVSVSTMTVRYQARVSGTTAAGPYSGKYAPRLSSFSYCSGSWQLVSHANFDPLDG